MTDHKPETSTAATSTTTDGPLAVDFWVDPACPWCWMTARWAVDQVAPQRDIKINWQPISLFFKNQPPVGSEYYEGTYQTLRMLRVMEAIRRAGGDGAENKAIFDWYWLCGTRIHHDHAVDFDFAEALTSIGCDPALATAADDEAWDVEVRARMDAGLALVGNDVGTPIIAFTTTAADGSQEQRGIFGPVISRLPDEQRAVEFWDAMVVFSTTDGFWELKRTRTEGPQMPERPAI